MQAFVIEGPGATGFRDLPEPSPAAGQVLLRVEVIGLCGSDLNTYRGLNPMVTYPRIPGHEIGAVVEAVGDGVPASVAVGQAVTVSPYTSCGICPACRRHRPNCCRDNQTLGVQRDGALTRYLVVPAEKLVTVGGLSLSELAMIEPLSIGFHAASRGQITPADTVAVFGCGMVGLGAVAGAAARGGRVIAIDLDDRKLEVAQAAGATHLINSAATSLGEALRRLTDGDGPEVAIEAVGHPATYLAAAEQVAFAGRVVYIGYAKEPVCYETKQFVQKELDIKGSRNALPGDFETVARHLASGRFPTAAVVTHTYALADAGAALRHWQDQPGDVLKIQITVGG